ncbi:hypothetical protein C8035_v007552 [Colletotrichum spinosum]|uniref:Uncharacterized protein n=1 Tax=Colletotrichum spinosum TaxID=1347390 RepID=A0A4R8PRT3_9PEZI|nr:hypothetical protein C8035_v007552 [Colletotrichum spinosum]
MSGLEPLAALGLACNILQLVGSVKSTITVAKNILDSGTIDPSLAKQNEDLTKLFGDAQDSVNKAPAPLAKDDQDLQDVARKALATAISLKEELAKISGDRRAIGGALKVPFRRRKLEELQTEILACQRALDTRLLMGLRYFKSIFNF